MPPDRTFLLVANRADPSGKIPLDDLPGAGGRFDLVARFVVASLLTSHGIREDARAIVCFTRAEPEPVALSIAGSDVVGIRPDERATAARLMQALEATAMPVWQDVGRGIEAKATTLGDLLSELPAPRIGLHETGEPLEGSGLTRGSFVLGDQDGLTDEQRALVDEAAERTCSVGPVPLQADQVVTVVHNALDRAAI